MSDVLEDDDSDFENPSAYPPSIQAGIPKLGETPKGWKRHKLGDLLQRVERPARLVDSETYQLVTAKRNRGGIVARETLRGEQIRTKTQFYVEAGDFLISNRQISHGACGVVPESLHWAVVSNEYTAFHTSEALDPAFLNVLSHSVYFQQTCFHSSIGVHVEKLVFRLEDWMGWKFDIPPLEQQKRIVTVLDTWDQAIEQMETMIAAKRKRLSSLLSKLIFTRSRAHGRNDVSELVLKDLGTLVRGVTYEPEADIVRERNPDSVTVLTAGNVQSGRVTIFGDETQVVAKRVRHDQIARKGDFVLSMSNGSKSLVGKAGYVFEDFLTVAAPGAFCAIFRPKSPEAGLVASMLFQSDGYREQLHIALAGSSINNLTNGELEEFRFFVTSALQTAKPEFFRSISDDLIKAEATLTKLHIQKRGLMQKLLTGEWGLDERFDSPEAALKGKA